MTKIKKIAIITIHTFGYVDFIVDRLNSMENVDLTYVNIDLIPFSYRNKFSRISNFFFKLFLSQGLKEKNKTNFIKKVIKDKNIIFDQVMIFRHDKFQKDALIYLKENTIEMTCFLFDGIENYKGQKKTLYLFDTVYSYDKNDVQKYNFQFLTNYIYDDEIQKETKVQTVFNISSFDKRVLFLEKLAYYLKDKNISFRFIVKRKKICNRNNIEIVDQYLPLHEVKKIIAKSSVLIDIQRGNQSGLSFRVFEALGYQKKLITSNADIVNYDFYDKNNIWVISETNYEIPTAFFETDYQEIQTDILNKYKLSNWISVVFKIN
ncbi:hypothetical protein IWX83_001268 [Flavobacterium sp. CG_9.1]|uniref:hypothetical protein n=1 Tax=Flavobacterium sp. CG_9.1 TaxID=2787728 RepID=UPI0018CAA755|nr:hypothetical protein [Flavobacterium sp. CG_9.1]MBG6061485.1 hypothetical protein [Flavobacterium sp. CG_9.1]